MLLTEKTGLRQLRGTKLVSTSLTRFRRSFVDDCNASSHQCLSCLKKVISQSFSQAEPTDCATMSQLPCAYLLIKKK